ncbi:MAG: peptide chain release factor 2 [Devosia sp.]|uniref:peptide chain release factor 2 n=1 Tax=Devosia sp. 66-22 TaxID=1895753 RepID=UPI001AD31EFE|nr:peptide chain release factor 2 [Devosia sp. 66-22]MBN9348783.1 peptide chain release factor 2 [Devosia sp.]
MRAEIQKSVDEIEQVLNLLRRHLDWDTAEARLEDLNNRTESPDFWSDPEKARDIMRQRDELDVQVKAVRDFSQQVKDNIELIELGEAEGDADIVKEAETAIEELVETARRVQIETLLNGEADHNDCYLEIHAGAGGTESQDWASMLLRMYTRWAERRGFRTETLELHPGEEAGIKSATIQIKGHNAYGWLKTEAGVHRLVRISPYDSAARRHTSFSSAWVYPVVDDTINIEINESDLKVDTYRSSGAGGQHVNTTDSAIRITHLPSGIIVACQQERSQHKNRATAMAMLKSRLYEQELEKREAAANAEAASKTEIGWGHQIRSYVLQPYQMVKDLRTNFETSNTGAVLDGDLDDFMEASLASRVQGYADKAE